MIESCGSPKIPARMWMCSLRCLVLDWWRAPEHCRLWAPACEEKVFCCLSESEWLPVCQPFDECPPHSVAFPPQQTSPLERYEANIATKVIIFLFFFFSSTLFESVKAFWTHFNDSVNQLPFFFAPVGFFSSGADLLLTAVYFNLTPAWRSYLGSLWARGRNSFRLTRERAHLCPRSSQKEAVLCNNYSAPPPTILSSCHM